MDKAKKDLIGQLFVVGAVIAGGVFVYRKFIKPEEKSSVIGNRQLIKKGSYVSAPITNCFCDGKFVTKVRCHPNSNCCPPCKKDTSLAHTNFSGSKWQDVAPKENKW